MQRRTFLKDSALCAVAVSASGFIRFDGKKYVGDCETTTDILGPFYRPGSPVRNNLLMKGAPGTIMELTGTILHNDCITPFKNAKIELWHCDNKGVYDNNSDDYRYRGTSFSDNKGRYSFRTIIPVPYDTGQGMVRPAHFHLMITAEGYQPFVTQLYFSGDANISKDSYASSPAAKRRILKIQTSKDGAKKVLFDVGMSGKLAAEPAVIDKLTGTYVDKNDKTKTIELFKKNNLLWMKNQVFGENLDYTGNNTFEFPGMPPGQYAKFHFEILPAGNIQLHSEYANEDMVKHSAVLLKEK